MREAVKVGGLDRGRLTPRLIHLRIELAGVVGGGKCRLHFARIKAFHWRYGS
jgi:hypothetical protein